MLLRLRDREDGRESRELLGERRWMAAVLQLGKAMCSTIVEVEMQSDRTRLRRREIVDVSRPSAKRMDDALGCACSHRATWMSRPVDRRE